jgi:hypothetical protein
MTGERVGKGEEILKTIEEKILGGVLELLLTGVNGVLAEIDDDVPPVERPGAARPCRCAVELAAAERTEKERIVRLDAYAVKVTFYGSEADCYRYGYALNKAVEADWTLGALAESVCFERKVYKKTAGGVKADGCEAVFSLKIIIEALLW